MSDNVKVFRANNKALELERELERLKIENRQLEMANYELAVQLKKLENEINKIKKEPLVVGTVEEVLSNGKVVAKTSGGNQFLVSTTVPVKAGDRVAMAQQSLAILSALPRKKDYLAMAAEIVERPSVRFSDIGGLDKQIKELEEVVELPLKNPEVFEKVGIDPPSGVLLYGPPGCGKTLLVKALAGESNATFIKLVGSELVRKYIGEGAKLVKDVFGLAREKAPSILFIDEIDAIAARRLEETTGGDREVNRTLMQLLAELDGFDDRGDVKIVAATNRADILDPAILRPGRFDRVIEVPMPDENARLEILRIHTRKMNLARNLDLTHIAKLCEGATGADIKAICTEAGIFAIRENRKSVKTKDFMNAVEKVLGPRDEEEKMVHYT